MIGTPDLAGEVTASSEGWHISDRRRREHHRHAFAHLNPLEREGLVVASRRNLLKASLAGLAGLSLPGLLRRRASAAEAGRPIGGSRAVILLWMAGGPSHIDTWDPKPDRTLQNRGPFGIIPTRLPGVLLCEHLPKQAAMLDRFTIIRSVDARYSNHEPNKVFQTANREAEPRLNPSGEMYPAIRSLVAKHHGANRTGLPPYVAFQTSRTHIAYGGTTRSSPTGRPSCRSTPTSAWTPAARPKRTSSGCRRA
jgi:hypothetical protein